MCVHGPTLGSTWRQSDPFFAQRPAFANFGKALRSIEFIHTTY